MSAWYERIRRFYKTTDSNGDRLWNKYRVKRAVDCNKLTEVEYEEITGEAYSSE